MDSQIDYDSVWFENHPFAIQYYRKPFENELAQSLQIYGKQARKMLIYQITKGLRGKKFIF